MEEEIVRLGSNQRLVGIVTPAADETGAPAVIILNAGIVHRVGPNRLHVRLARRLAAQGHTVLRFDLSGIGDSAADVAAESLEASLFSDLRAATDFLGARGHDRFILFGLCSGAHLAVFYSPTDERVVGTVLIDPEIPPTVKSLVVKIRSRLLRPQAWWSLLTGRLSLLPQLRAATGSGPTEPAGNAALETGTEALRSMVARGAQLFVIFTGGHRWCNYREHFLDVFPSIDFGEQLRLEYREEADHIFSFEESQRRLVESVAEWTASAGFRSPAATPETVEVRAAGQRDRSDHAL
jgi:pimeloyl-ACP methyl ester carboxylesterase